MKNTKIIMSLVASSLLASSLLAQDINLKSGWNLVSVNNQYTGGSTIPLNLLGDSITSISSFDYVQNPFTGMSTLQPVSVSNLKPSQAYWIKSNRDTTISISTNSTTVKPTLVAGWNFVGFPSKEAISTAFSSYENSGYKMDAISSFNYVANPFTGTSALQPVSVSTLNYGQGYWVKVSVKAFEATTLDGYSVKAYANSTADASAIKTQIENSMVNDLYMINDWENVTEVTIGHNGTDASSIATSSISQTTINNAEQQLAGNITITPIYVQGMTVGGAPFILNHVAIYKASDNSLIGYTDESGYLNSVALTPGTKIILKKDGYVTKTATLGNGSAEYIFVEKYDFQEIAQINVDSSGNPRVLNRQLNYIPISNRIQGKFDVFVPQVTKLKKTLLPRVIQESNQMSIVESSKLKQQIDTVANNGYSSEVIGVLNYGLKKTTGRGKHKKVSFLHEPYSGYYPSGTEAKIYFALGIDTYYKIVNYNSNPGKNLRVMYYDGSWKNLPSSDFRIKSLANISSDAKQSYDDKGVFGTINDDSKYVIEIKSQGFYPHAIVYDEKAIKTYQIKVNIKDNNSSANIAGAAIYLGNSYLGSTDTNGNFDYNITAKSGDLSFGFSADKLKYNASQVKTLQVSSLNNGGITNVNITLKAKPNVGSVEGTVYDANLSDVVDFADVKLYYPYSLGADVVKVKNNSIQVGAQANTTYTWYIKIYDDTTTPTPYTLKRASKKRWIEVQSGDSTSKGYVLTFKKIKQQLLKNKESSDHADVLGAMVSGTFELAIKVAHDLDADGTVDLIELAALKDNANTVLVTTKENENSDVSNYATSLGKINIELNMVKFAKNAIADQRLGTAVDVNGTWFYASDYDSSNNTHTEYYDNLSGVVTTDDDLTLKLSKRIYSLEYTDISFLSNDYKVSYSVGVYSSLGDGTGVCLVKDSSGIYHWKKINITDDSRTYTEMYKQKALFEVGFIERKGGNVKGSDLKLSIAKASKFISQNAIMEKLNMTMDSIAKEIGNTKYSKSDANKTLMQTGLGLAVTGMIETKNTGGDDVKVIAGNFIASNAIDDLSTYLNIKHTDIKAPIKTISVYNYITKADGKYKFANLPMEYAQLNGKAVSMLNVNARKFAHKNSATVNVAKYNAGDVNNQDLNLLSKDLVPVTIKIVDTKGKAVVADNISIDGLFEKINNITDKTTESSSISTDANVSQADFKNIIAGKRVINVKKYGWYPVNIEKGVYSSNANNFTITLKKASDLDKIIAPSLTIVGSSLNYAHGSIVLNLQASDTTSSGLYKNSAGNYLSNIIIYKNGKKVKSKQTIDDNGAILATIVPDIGKNKIYATIINPKGDMTTLNTYLDYNPLVGTIKGSIDGFKDANSDSKLDSDYFAVVNIYDDSSNYIESVAPNDKGEYFANKLSAGKIFVQAEVFYKDGSLVQQSNKEELMVVGGITKKQSLTVSDVTLDSSNWTPDIKLSANIDEASLSAQAAKNDGNITLSGTVDKFDKLNGAQLVAYVDGMSYSVNENSIVKKSVDTNSSYNWNIALPLAYGSNTVSIEAVNSNNNADTTVVFNVDNNASGLHTYTLDYNITDIDTNESIPYATISIDSPVSGYNMHSGSNGTFTNLLAGPYDIDITANGYTTKAISDDLEALDKKDGTDDNIIKINATLKNLSTQNIISTTISDIDVNQSNNTQGYMTFEVGKDVNFKIIVNGTDKVNKNLEVVNLDDGSSIDNKTTSGNLTQSFSQPGDYKVIAQLIDSKDVTRVVDSYERYFTVVDVLEKPIPVPSIPNVKDVPQP